MTETYSPVIYDEAARQHRVLSSGQPLDPSHILVSTVSGNLLESSSDGLSVRVADVVSSDSDNLLRVVDGKLLVKFTADDTGVISGDTGNYLRYGLDKGVFVDGNDILSNGVENMLVIDGTDNRIALTRKQLQEAGFVVSSDLTVVSSDSGNLLKAGSDGGAYLDEASVPTGVSEAAGNILTVGSDGKPYLAATGLPSVVSTVTGNLISDQNGAFLSAATLLGTGSDNLLQSDSAGRIVLSKATVESLVADGVDDAVTPSKLVSMTAGNLLSVGTDGKLKATSSDLISSDAGNIIKAGSDSKLYAPKATASELVNGADLLLTTNAAGELTSVLSATYNNTTGLLSLLGKNGQTIASVTVQSSGTVLESATIVTNPSGQPAGTYLAMTFRLADGTSNTVYADLSALADVYSAGSGVDISNYVVAVKLASNGGLEFDSTGSIKMTTSAANPVSGNTGNLLANGTDGKAFLPSDFGTM